MRNGDGNAGCDAAARCLGDVRTAVGWTNVNLNFCFCFVWSCLGELAGS